MQLGPDKGLLAEINVTPLVDVMLVLLIIFMMSASIETVQAKRKAKKESEAEKQKVEVNLPRTDAKVVNLSKDQTLVLTFTKKMRFYLQDIPIQDCAAMGAKPGKYRTKRFNKAYDACLDALTKKLVTNEKLKQDAKLYLKADRDLPYGLVLRVMARVRQGGVSKFGLIAEPAAGGGKKR